MLVSMHLTFLILATLTQCVVKDKCLVGEPPAELVAAHRMLAAHENASAPRLKPRDALLNIDLYMHVIESEATKGDTQNDVVQQQVSTIVDTFNEYDIVFHYKGVDYTVNDEWATADAYDDFLDRGLALRKGGYTALNVYIVSDLNALGVCTFPYKGDFIPGIGYVAGTDEITNNSKNFVAIDGCTIVSGTLPGRFYDDEPRTGFTAVHEIGHWLGLFHTFQGEDCLGPGDLIADTRVEASAASGCPKHRVSCPNATFTPTPEDPFHNYMDYTSDDCYTNFTPLQMVRARGIFPIFRASQDSASSSASTQSTGVPLISGTVSSNVSVGSSTSSDSVIFVTSTVSC